LFSSSFKGGATARSIQLKKRRSIDRRGLKLDHAVERPALRTTGTLDIAVVGVNEAALFATKNIVFAGCGLESPPTMLEIYCHARKRRK
jgi:hypothetical protein